jgi:hypothetical protein
VYTGLKRTLRLSEPILSADGNAGLMARALFLARLRAVSFEHEPSNTCLAGCNAFRYKNNVGWRSDVQDAELWEGEAREYLNDDG